MLKACLSRFTGLALGFLLTVLLLAPPGRIFAASPSPLAPNQPVCLFESSDYWTYCGVNYGEPSQAYILPIHTSNSDIHHNFHMQLFDSAMGVWYDQYNWHLYFDGAIDMGPAGPGYEFHAYDSVTGVTYDMPIDVAQCIGAPGNIYGCAKTASDDFIDDFYGGSLTTTYPNFRVAMNTKHPWDLPDAFCNVVHYKHVLLGWTADCTPQ